MYNRNKFKINCCQRNAVITNSIKGCKRTTSVMQISNKVLSEDGDSYENLVKVASVRF